MGAGGNGNDQWQWDKNWNRNRLNLGPVMGMVMNHWEWERIEKDILAHLYSRCP